MERQPPDTAQKLAYQEGYDAFKEGKPRSFNPYRSALGYDWDGGWTDAMSQSSEAPWTPPDASMS